MANKNIEQFIATYGPVAVQVGNEINVNPNVLLSQWGMESRWGQSVPASFNVGGIKDFSGTGEKGKDNKTGSVDKYVKFEDPEVFGMYYADMIKRNFPKAVGTGDDVGAFSRGLSEGKRGSYFEIPATEYEQAITNAKTALPSNLPFSPKEQSANGDMVPGPAPASKTAEPAEPDTSGASRAEQFLFGGIGAGTGAVVSTGKGFMDASTGMAAKKAAAEETARIGVQRAAAAAPSGVPGPAGSAATTPTASRVALTPATQPLTQGAANPLLATDNQATRILQGTTGDEGTTGRARMGFLEDTSQQASQRKEMDRVMSQLKQAGVAPDEARAFFAKQPGMTSTPSGVRYPRSVPAPTLGPRTYGPPSIQAQAAQSGALPIKETAPYQIGGGKPPPIPAAPPMPKGPSGLDAVTDMFKTMMRPLKPVINAGMIAGKYAFPPLAGLGAGLEFADVAHEFDKKPEQRDYTKMGLQSATGIGGVLSMFPPTMPFGIPLATGAGLAQAYRNDPEMINRALQKLNERAGDMPYSDPMTGYTAP